MGAMCARAWALCGLSALLLVNCRSRPKDDDLEPIHSGPGENPGSDSGVNDAGPPADDGGAPPVPDAGTPDAGPPDAGYTLTFPSSAGWQFYGPQHGGPRNVYGVSADGAGNLWVAGGAEGLFLLEPGASQFRRFTVADGLTGYASPSGTVDQPVLSVAGGPSGTVFVGYRGVHGGADENDPPEMVKSGDADRVVWDGTALRVTHFDLATPPGTDPHYPQGRDKIRDVFRIVYHPGSGDVWFGGNHGIAMWNGRLRKVDEHQHAAINGFTASGAYTLLSGDWYGLALDPAGDVWLGGGHRLARLKFASEHRQFWAAVEPIHDVWPDAQPVDPRPEERTDDFIQDLAVMPDGTVWVGSIPNGLAHVTPSGVRYVTSGMIERKVTALEADPTDGSLWVGHMWGGITRLAGGTAMHYDYQALGIPLANGTVMDIQSDTRGGQRRILVAFSVGAIGIYTGP